MDKFLFVIANAIAFLFGLLALVTLPFTVLQTITGEHQMQDYIVLATIAVVPYCFAGTLYRSWQLSQKSKTD